MKFPLAKEGIFVIIVIYLHLWEKRGAVVAKELEVTNELGLHARVASRVTRAARGFKSSVTVQKSGKAFDLKNVTGVLTVNARKGDILTVEFEGEDEKAAAEAIAELFAAKFGEK
jgi:phosphocarrier protein